MVLDELAHEAPDQLALERLHVGQRQPARLAELRLLAARAEHDVARRPFGQHRLPQLDLAERRQQAARD